MFELIKTFGPIVTVGMFVVMILYNKRLVEQRDILCDKHHKTTNELSKRIDQHDIALATNAERFKAICIKLDDLKSHNDDSGKWRGKYDSLFLGMRDDIKSLINKEK